MTMLKDCESSSGAGPRRSAYRRWIAVLAVVSIAASACGSPRSNVTESDGDSTTTTLGPTSRVGCTGPVGSYIGEQPVGPGGYRTSRDALASHLSPDILPFFRSTRISPQTEVFAAYSEDDVLVAIVSVTQSDFGTYYVSGSESCAGYKDLVLKR